ncbi:MAG: twin-arginine translocase subunit TatC [Verrucomicrobia bacterium]|nr:twin-arginine translocase subunit TatC [Verrucomicrobiota bacterium]
MGDARSSASTADKPFVEHLDDLRRAVIGAVVALGIGLLIAIPLAPWIIKALKYPLLGTGVDPDEFLKVIRVGDGFAVALQVMFWSGLLIALPGILMALARFVFPGLTPRERRVVSRSMIAASLLFVVGVLFGYFTTIQLSVMWLLRINDWLGIRYDFIELADYCGFVLRLLIGFGLVFELPVVVVALGAVGVIHAAGMREKRRHVYVGLMALAMVLTPPDVMSMLAMTIPLVLLFEACIWIVHFQARRHAPDSDVAAD